jgi:nicotinamidase-related amidase
VPGEPFERARTRLPESPLPERNRDLHGNVPDTAPAALLLIDVINDLEFDSGEALLEHALPMARRLRELKRRVKALGLPAIYVNDNYGQWQSDFGRVVRHCLEDDVRGRPIAELLAPEDDDYFVLKPKHSGFFNTSLDILLRYIQAETLIITGMAGNICVLFTANDAYMRDFRLLVPIDCTASSDPDANAQAVELMARHLKADTTPSDRIDLEALRREQR